MPSSSLSPAGVELGSSKDHQFGCIIMYWNGIANSQIQFRNERCRKYQLYQKLLQTKIIRDTSRWRKPVYFNIQIKFLLIQFFSSIYLANILFSDINHILLSAFKIWILVLYCKSRFHWTTSHAYEWQPRK